MKKGFLFVLVSFLMCSCFNDDYNEDVLMDILYNNRDERLFSYSSIPESQKQMLWHEEFDNNDSKWPFDISRVYEIYDKYDYFPYTTATISDGFLILTTTRWMFREERFDIPVIFEENKNCEIEIRALDRRNEISITFNNENEQEYSTHLHTTTKDGVEILSLWGTAIYGIYGFLHYEIPQNCKWLSNQFNTVTIRKIENNYAFFVNHSLFYVLNDKNLSDKNLFIKTVTLWIGNSNTMYDYVRVQYIND